MSPATCEGIVCDLVRCGAMSSTIEQALGVTKLDVECDNQFLENVWLRSCATPEVVVSDLDHPNST